MAHSTHEDALATITEELARQDAAWAAAIEGLRAFEGCELRVPEIFFHELDDACVVHAASEFQFVGLRA